MKIMQAIGGAGHGGAETFFVSLAGAFHRAGHEQLLAMRANDVRRAQLEEQGLSPIELKFGGRFDFRTKPHLQKLANEFKPDIFISWMSRASQVTPSGDFLKIARHGGYYKIKNFRKCDHIVTNTEEICQTIVEQGWPQDKTHYIPNFISWAEAPPVSRAALDTPDEATVLLSLGRLHHNKAMDTALHVLKKLDHCYLWIGGTGALQEDLGKLAEKLGVSSRVRFLGWRTDKEALFAAADICLYPSRVEPFGNVILDAWASGTPIVAAASAGPAAYISHEKNGLLCEIDHVEEMADRVQTLIDNPAVATELARCGKTEFESKFTEQAAVQNWVNLFERLT